eukprot:1161761-Pelagomonas_calceolata.AAC.9
MFNHQGHRQWAGVSEAGVLDFLRKEATAPGEGNSQPFERRCLLSLIYVGSVCSACARSMSGGPLSRCTRFKQWDREKVQAA